MALERMETFLESLPNGIDSYPLYTQKASWCRDFIQRHPRILRAADRLPKPLTDFVRAPRLVNDWMPEVHCHALYLSTCDLVFDSDEAWLEDIYRLNERMFRGPLYRMLMMVASPSIVVRGAVGRWEAFHRGIKLRARDLSASSVTLHLSYPTNLVPPIIARGYAQTFRAAVEAANGHEARFELVQASSIVSTFEGTWH